MSDDLICLLALNRVRELRDLWGDAIPESELAKGVDVEGETVLLKGPQGIFKPRQLTDGPLTVMSTLGSRYEDEVLDDANTVRYDYAPPSREHENDGLKRVMAKGKPVILLKQSQSKKNGSTRAIPSRASHSASSTADGSSFQPIQPTDPIPIF